MSVTVRPYVNGGWEVDIRVQLPDGSVIRERKKAAASSKQAAQKWAERITNPPSRLAESYPPRRNWSVLRMCSRVRPLPAIC